MYLRQVDPVRVSEGGQLTLAKNRESLGAVVRQIWSRIANSHANFPDQLQRCFYKIR